MGAAGGSYLVRPDRDRHWLLGSDGDGLFDAQVSDEFRATSEQQASRWDELLRG